MITEDQAPDATTRSDETPPSLLDGLVWAFHFDESGQPREIAAEAVPATLGAHTGWIWLHFNLVDTRAITWLKATPLLDDEARAILTKPATRPSLAAVSGGRALAGVIADFHREYDGPTTDLGRLHFWLSERVAISGRRHPLRSVEEMRQTLGRGRRLPEAAGFLVAIIRQFAHFAAEAAITLADELDDIEDGSLSGRAGLQAEIAVGTIRRSTLRLHREIVALRAAMKRLHSSLAADEQECPVLHPVAPLVSTLDEVDHDLGVVQDRARMIQDELAARAASETNRQLYVLSILTALFLPPTLISGIFGMNTKDLPLQNTEGGSIIALALGAGVTLSVYLLLRWGRLVGPTSKR